MMKNTLFLLSFFFTTFLYSQNAGNTDQTDISLIPDYDVVKTKMNLTDVVIKADTIPEFPGGIKVFKRKYFENIETLEVKIKEKVETRLYFIVEKSGYVRNVTTIGSNKKHAQAAELGLRRITTLWKPATINGEPVRYLMYFQLKNKEF